MGLFIKLLLFLVILVLALPFVLKDEEGQPLMTVSDLKKPDLGLTGVVERLPEIKNPFSDAPAEGGDKKTASSEKTIIYSWRDEQGNMHFTNQPPEDGKQANTMKINPNINVMPAVKQSSADEGSGIHQAAADTQNVQSLYTPEGVNRVLQDAGNTEGALQRRMEEYDQAD